MIIKKCKCGSIDFIIDEATAHGAQVDDDGILTTCGGDKNSEILKIICENCGKVYKEEDFKQINF